METQTKEDYLLLKWGTLKGWHLHSKKGIALLKEYHSLGSSFSAMAQKDAPRQKEIILELIDECNGTIQNDWNGEIYTKDEAKKYILEYGKKLL
jgi:hypothetical protein